MAGKSVLLVLAFMIFKPTLKQALLCDERKSGDNNISASIIPEYPGYEVKEKESEDDGSLSENFGKVCPHSSEYQNLSFAETLLFWESLVCGGSSSFCKPSQQNPYQDQPGLVTCDICLCDDCDIYGDCCLGDSFLRNQSSGRLGSLECLSGTEGWYSADSSKGQSYYLVGRCPESYTDVKTKEACEDRTRQVIDVLHSPPVYSPASRLSYMNSHCAKCHEDSKLILMWTPNLICTDLLRWQTIKSREDLFQLAKEGSACHLSFLPPLNSVFRKCQRFEPISKCNVTGEWLEYDPVLQEACGLYSHIVNIYDQRYRNIFCAMCNGVNEGFEGLIPGLTQRETAANVVQFSRIFDLSPNIPSSPTSGKKECAEDSVYDTFKNKCRELVCSEGRIVSNHSCVDLFGTAHGLAYRLRFEVTPEKLNHKQDEIWQAVKDAMKPLSRSLNPSYERLLMFEYNITTQQRSAIKAVPLWLEYTIIVGTRKSQEEAEIHLLDTLTSSWFVHSAPARTDFFNANAENGAEKFTQNTLHESETHATQLFDAFLNETSVITLNMLSRCNQIELDDSEIFVNSSTGTITLNDSSEELNIFEYVVVDNHTRVCVNFSGWYVSRYVLKDVDEIGRLLTMVTLAASVTALFLTFLLSLYSKSRHTVPGLITIMLVITLFFAQGFFLFLALAARNKWACQIVGLLTHYSWLVVFAWKNVAAFHMYVAFTQPFTCRSTTPRSVLQKYALYAFGTPAILVTSYVVAQAALTNQESLGYTKTCFLAAPVDLGVAFISPITFVIITNSYFFGRVVYALKRMSQFEKNSNQNNSAHTALFIKMSLMLGFLWAVGFVANIVHSEVLWYVFDILNGGVGVLHLLVQISSKQTIQRLKRALFDPNETKATSSTKLEFTGQI